MVEAAQLTVSTLGVRVTVVDEGGGADALLAVAKAVLRGAENNYSPHASLNEESSRSGQKCRKNKDRSSTASVREIATRILADGCVHERREIAKAARDAGIPQKTVNQMSGLLDRHFEKGTNVDGRPTYRDPSVPSPYTDPRSVPEGEKYWSSGVAAVNGSPTRNEDS